MYKKGGEGLKNPAKAMIQENCKKSWLDQNLSFLIK